jgi:hypothetical protein
LFFRRRQFGTLSGRDFYETVTTRSHFVAWLYRSSGAISGTCGDVCTDVCEHKVCTKDYVIGRDGVTCTCLRNQTSSCVTNAECSIDIDDNESCFCSQGYEGNGTIQCVDVNECLEISSVCGPNRYVK